MDNLYKLDHILTMQQVNPNDLDRKFMDEMQKSIPNEFYSRVCALLGA